MNKAVKDADDALKSKVDKKSFIDNEMAKQRLDPHGSLSEADIKQILETAWLESTNKRDWMNAEDLKKMETIKKAQKSMREEAKEAIKKGWDRGRFVDQYTS